MLHSEIERVCKYAACLDNETRCLCAELTFNDIVIVSQDCYRSGTVNSKSFVSKVLLRIKWKFEVTVHFKHEMLGQ